MDKTEEKLILIELERERKREQTLFCFYLNIQKKERKT